MVRLKPCIGVYIGVRSGYVPNQYQHSVRAHAPISPVTKHGVFVYVSNHVWCLYRCQVQLCLNQYQHSVRVHAPISHVTKHGVFVCVSNHVWCLYRGQVRLCFEPVSAFSQGVCANRRAEVGFGQPLQGANQTQQCEKLFVSAFGQEFWAIF